VEGVVKTLNTGKTLVFLEAICQKNEELLSNLNPQKLRLKVFLVLADIMKKIFRGSNCIQHCNSKLNQPENGVAWL